MLASLRASGNYEKQQAIARFLRLIASHTFLLVYKSWLSIAIFSNLRFNFFKNYFSRGALTLLCCNSSHVHVFVFCFFALATCLCRHIERGAVTALKQAAFRNRSP